MYFDTMSNEQKNKTGKFIYGAWYFEGNVKGSQFKIILSINEEKLVINNYIANIYKDGKEISSNAHWYEDYLCFTEGQKYFVRYADEKKMVFGEFTVAGVIGVPAWEHEFTRMKEA